MKKITTAIILGILLVSALGAIAVSAAAQNDTRTGYVSGNIHRWAARYTDSGYGAGNFPHCPYYDNTDGTVELEVKNVDEAFEIARAEIDDSISKDDIYQKGRWWIVYYEGEDGVYTQARIDAVTGEVYTGYDVPSWCQAGAGYGRSSGYGRGSGYCMGYGR